MNNLLFISLLLSFCASSCGNDIRYRDLKITTNDTDSRNKLVADSLPNIANGLLIIEQDYDLGGESIHIPEGTRLVFEGGRLLNGTISGRIRNEYLLPEWFGAIGDNIVDDTRALECLLQSSIDTRTKVLLKGQYKITRPITFRKLNDDASAEILPLSVNIEGCSNSQITSDHRNQLSNIADAAIIAYNLKDSEAALNFLGNSVPAAQSNMLKNFCIFLDRRTCSELSFCLRIGNADNFYAEKMDFLGYNNVIIRSGEVDDEDDVGFIFARGTFQNCRFRTWEYLDVSRNKQDSKTLFSNKGRFGFCIINERFLKYTNIGKSSVYDSIKFNSCHFVGSCYLCGNTSFDMCMWETPGVYKPLVEKDTRFRYLPFIDTSISVFIYRGNVVFNNCHFEDCLKPIFVYNTAKSTDYQQLLVKINDCTFVPWLNHTYQLNGNKLKPLYLVKASKSKDATSEYKIHIEGGQVLHASDRMTPDIHFINEGAKWFYVERVMGTDAKNCLGDNIKFIGL